MWERERASVGEGDRGVCVCARRGGGEGVFWCGVVLLCVWTLCLWCDVCGV